ncbi:HNH/ENDO VII family nuclease [Alishewanella sp. d11]|uniref:HNH/ENDO VII family nuclease n=1 Tax=Alishewanella sp. d11 TaxID=3414030 RepID=UPI003BF806EF
MDIKTVKDIAYADKPVLFESFGQKSLSPDFLKSLDQPITDKIKIRDTLEPLNDEQKQELSDIGYSDSVIEAIGSKEEADIYKGAELECEKVNGNDALIRTDIDLDQKDDFGNTNLERMEKGKAPLDKEGKPIELHHIGQTSDAPLAELTRSEHMGNGNDSILHDKAKESEIDRSEFKKEREEHWKARAEEIKQKLGIENE